ncbi:MAG: SDR family oxidoreductase [Bradyrhizobium sp.]|nr:SDR family oxidoreductase [Bradyrhizobium sp.]
MEGKVAIVTGAGRGIGRGIAVEFAREGARVVVASRSQSTVDRTVAEIRAEGGMAIGVVCDVGELADVQRTVAETIKEFNSIDILVNNAQSFGTAEEPAPSPVLTPLQDFRDGEWDRTFVTGPTATYWFMKAAFPYLKASGQGRVINMGSHWGQIGFAGAAAYDAAKEAIRGLSRVAAREWGQYGITVNVINPMIETDALHSFADKNPEASRAGLAVLPLRRYGDIYKDGGRVAVFLAGPDSAYLTGMTFQVDGGLFLHP